MWCPEQDVKVAPTECVARAITCGVQGLVLEPLVGFRGTEPLKLSGFYSFLWRSAFEWRKVSETFMEHDFFPKCRYQNEISFTIVIRGRPGSFPIHHLLRNCSSLLSNGRIYHYGVARGRKKGACAPGATLGGAEMTFENKMTQRKKKSFWLIFDQKGY